MMRGTHERATPRGPDARPRLEVRPLSRAVPTGRGVARTCSVALVLGLAASPGYAQKWAFTPGFGLTGTATNNVNLEPNSTRQGDFVTEITPTLQFSERSARTALDGSLSVPVVLYARTGSENNTAYPSFNLLGDLDAYDRIVHLEGAINVSQQFFTPFGPQPVDFTNATNNRYTATTYRVSPYVKGVAPNGIAYELRNNNVWSNLNGAPISTSNSRYTEFLGNVSTPEDRRLGVRANYDYTDTKFENQDGSLQMQIGRVVPFYGVSPQLRLDATLGYENNQGTLTDSSGTVYGVGFRWRPTERTDVVGSWEHRFFGSSYHFTFDHRTPLTVWNVNVSRDITTYPQQLANLTGGTDVGAFLNNLYLSSIPDPVARQQAVTQFLNQRGLPNTISGPVTLYAQQIQLLQQQSASVGLIGARNTIVFSVFNVLTRAIAASGADLPPLLSGGNNNTQTGGAIVWTNRLTPSMNLITTLNGSRTVAAEPSNLTSRQGAVRVALTAPLGERTTGFVGARYQQFSSDPGIDYNEAAAFIGLTYVLR